MSNDVIKNHLRTALALLDLPPGVEAEDAREAADAIRAAVIEHGRPVEGDSYVDTIRRMAAERDAAIARAEKAEAYIGELVTLVGSKHRDLVDEEERADAAERARDEVGLQLAAAQAEIARMRPVVDAARDVRDEHMTDEPVMGRVMDRLIEAFRALDAVPGDALAPRITAALEASGIDTSNVEVAR